jgi:hypothetical protein
VYNGRVADVRIHLMGGEEPSYLADCIISISPDYLI